MTDLDRQAIRDYATGNLRRHQINAWFSMETVLALLDALEAAERYGIEMRDAARAWRERYIASERELQPRTVERDTWRERWLEEVARVGRAAQPDGPYSATVEIRDGRTESISYLEPEKPKDLGYDSEEGR